MKKFIAFAILLAATISYASAQGIVQVRGYYRSNGTYVQPHIRTAPDGIKSNNFSY